MVVRSGLNFWPNFMLPLHARSGPVSCVCDKAATKPSLPCWMDPTMPYAMSLLKTSSSVVQLLELAPELNRIYWNRLTLFSTFHSEWLPEDSSCRLCFEAIGPLVLSKILQNSTNWPRIEGQDTVYTVASWIKDTNGANFCYGCGRIHKTFGLRSLKSDTKQVTKHVITIEIYWNQLKEKPSSKKEGKAPIKEGLPSCLQHLCIYTYCFSLLSPFAFFFEARRFLALQGRYALSFKRNSAGDAFSCAPKAALCFCRLVAWLLMTIGDQGSFSPAHINKGAST